MRDVSPEVFLVSRPAVDYDKLFQAIEAMADAEAGEAQADRWRWYPDRGIYRPPSQDLTEAAGRICYKSWMPGVNPNVTRVREDQGEYLANVISSGHGSVLEHANYSFIFANVSRVLTHELVRHRAGTAVSQESLRYVRLEELPFWLPDWVSKDKDLAGAAQDYLERAEDLQKALAVYFGLDNSDVTFAEKKAATSFMRRFAPDGVATHLMWTANVRAIRHVIEARTARGAEEEIRLVFGSVAGIMKEEAPALFADFTQHDDGSWIPATSKV